MKHKTLYIGIDPGKNGGISAITCEGEPFSADKMPSTALELVETLEHVKECANRVHCVLEKVASSPQMGVVSAFSFGQGYGRIEGVLASLRIPYAVTSPQAWQKALGCMTGGNKNVSKTRAMQMFPAWKITHAIADSLLLAEYCRRQQVGAIQ
jgi:hypothetical protein